METGDVLREGEDTRALRRRQKSAIMDEYPPCQRAGAVRPYHFRTATLSPASSQIRTCGYIISVSRGPASHLLPRYPIAAGRDRSPGHEDHGDPVPDNRASRRSTPVSKVRVGFPPPTAPRQTYAPGLAPPQRAAGAAE